MSSPNFSGLFYDLLSGEFQPMSDPEGRKHTLARLAVATAIKGAFYEKDLAGIGDVFIYTPTWAPDVEAVVFGPKNQDKITSFSLFSSGDQALHFEDHDDQAIIECTLLNRPEVVELKLSADFFVARTMVANLAEVFFNNAHTASQRAQ